MLRPFTARQLSLVEGSDRVMVFAVLGDRYVGSAVQVHLPTLLRRLDCLPAEVDTLVFVDEPVPDAATIATIDDMLAAMEGGRADALGRYVPATDAVKRVEGDRVVEAIDRVALVGLRSPEVIRRPALERAVEGVGDAQWVNPTGLVAASGGVVEFFGLPSVPSRA